MANFGNIPIMTLINGYLLIFYTNICGLSPAACATLFLIARFLDAINDPLVGFIIDHLPTRKMGHFRPTLILGTILCSVNFLLLWFGPMLSTSGKLAIAYVSYILLGVLFPVMDISLNSLLPVMTEDMKERNSLSTIKGLAYVIGALVIGVAAPLILGILPEEGVVALPTLALPAPPERQGGGQISLLNFRQADDLLVFKGRVGMEHITFSIHRIAVW